MAARRLGVPAAAGTRLMLPLLNGALTAKQRRRGSFIVTRFMSMDDQVSISRPARAGALAAALLLLAAGGAAASGIFDSANGAPAAFAQQAAPEPPPAAPPAAAALPRQSAGMTLLQEIQESFRQVAAAVMPVVVKVDTTMPAGSRGRFNFAPPGGAPQPPPGGTGSGIILSHAGGLYYVLTNNHVVPENATGITVTLDDGRDYAAQLVGRDPRQDVAVISFRAPRGLPAARLGDSSRLQVGDLVLAVGSPFGFQSSVTSGIVSALERETTSRLDGANIAQYIQTDAAINPGNSGGALVNLQGEVIGLNTWIASRSGGSTGVGFALPINAAKRGIRDLIESGAVRYGYLGVFVSAASDEMRAALGVAEVEGALAWSVIRDSPAARGGLQPGDWVTHVDGEPVTGSGDLIRSVGALEPGRTSSFAVVRAGRPLQVQVRVALRDDSGQRVVRDWPGLYPLPLTERAREQLGVGNRRGVLAGQVNEGSAAAAAGLRQMDLITHVNGSAIRDAADFFRLLGAGDEDEYQVRILRSGRRMTVDLRP